MPPASFQLSAGWSGISLQVSSNIVSTVVPRATASISALSALVSRISSANTLLGGGWASLIYVRSRRSIVTLVVAGLIWTALFTVLAAGALALPQGGIAAVALAAGAGLGAGLS